MTTTDSAAPGTSSRPTAWRALTVAAAVLAPLALWALAVPLAGVELTAFPGGRPRGVGPVAVAVAGLVFGLAAWALLMVLERTVRSPGRVWSVVAYIVLVLSLAGPVTSGAAPVVVLVLAGMHVLVGVVLILGLGRSARA
ncbi:lysylphosphatidylglycerol synthetase-like protein (DUF2156 family) [Nocardiopsis arvandica]|uniref:Lysylphosphatidylglycerol synthetase-like protein (DUF2156 family) n=1 Tax=Nocardiopsis sinuspersici TaxID=501010 RepID=A0A7Y9XG74_9ACTN|nr:DUF6069 family protein [Nocardiopsis sinuspersici]NYH55267.1 lysylphosphatidylglycerol synthetase-like protein (DUF2156 family) [Nocardiopsis sinuspersici]